jgi:hypothetical protein
MRPPSGDRPAPRRNLCFLTSAPNIRGAAVVVAGIVALANMACDSRPIDGTPTPDGGPAMCANVGCASPPLCIEGCKAACGCCSCAPGERVGDLLCVGGCYVPAQIADGGSDSSGPADAHVDGWVPPAACLLPFEGGPCDAAINVYAHVNGACVQRVYGGCGGNGNRFSTLEECMATCEGRPVALPCPTGRVPKQICIACGAAGGCAKSIAACALTCDPSGAACPSNQPVCFDGVCQNAWCD